MTDQREARPSQRPTSPNQRTEEEELDRLWAEFSAARASLAEVMSDDELRAFGINVEVLDERP